MTMDRPFDSNRRRKKPNDDGPTVAELFELSHAHILNGKAPLKESDARSVNELRGSPIRRTRQETRG